jgi:nuclear receptor interaction protein
MRYTLQDRLFRRELGERSRYASAQGLYGDRCWIDEMDIVNELGGHTGCVNALRLVPVVLMDC